jgi:hypothetical protein
MKGKLTCYLCRQPIAEHDRGQFCWLQALESGAVRPLVASRIPLAPEHRNPGAIVRIAN